MGQVRLCRLEVAPDDPFVLRYHNAASVFNGTRMLWCPPPLPPNTHTHGSHVLTAAKSHPAWGPLTHFYRTKWPLCYYLLSSPFSFYPISCLSWHFFSSCTFCTVILWIWECLHVYEITSTTEILCYNNSWCVCVCVLGVTTLFLTLYSNAANEAEHKHAAAVWHTSFLSHTALQRKNSPQ